MRRRIGALAALAAFGLAAITLVVGSMFVGTAAAADDACAHVDEPTVGRLFGPTTSPEVTTVDGHPACEITVDGDLTVAVIQTGGGDAEFERQLVAHPERSLEAVDDYVDGAFFGWDVDDSLDFVARRGDETTIVRLTGTDPGSDFDSADPTASLDGGDLSGSPIGSSMWVLMTDVFARGADRAAQADAEDLSGLWRTTDITPCAPLSDLNVRVSDVADTGGSLRATKVTGDSCLDDGSVDFEGTTTGGEGQGVSFGGVGSATPAAGTPYELTVESPTQVSLTGEAGSQRYRLDYERLSWPTLAEATETSTLLGIPTPSEALTAKNVALTGAVSILLLLIVVFPTTLFNSALETNLDHYQAMVAKLRNKLRPTAPTGEGAVSFWRKPAGMAVYVLLAGFLFSLMQPGWGLNSATLVTFVGFVGAVAVTSTLGVLATKSYMWRRYRDGKGHSQVEPSTLGIAALFVLASRLVGFIPGYMYGVLVAWEATRDREDVDRSRITAIGSALTFAVAVVAWLLIPVCRNLGGADPNALESMPLSIAGGVFVGSAEALTIGLIPMAFLPGKLLKEHRPKTWAMLWGGGGFLFVLVLLRPGLMSGASQNVWGTVILAVISSLLALIFWLYQRLRTAPATEPVIVIPEVAFPDGAVQETATPPDAQI